MNVNTDLLAAIKSARTILDAIDAMPHGKVDEALDRVAAHLATAERIAEGRQYGRDAA